MVGPRSTSAAAGALPRENARPLPRHGCENTPPLPRYGCENTPPKEAPGAKRRSIRAACLKGVGDGFVLSELNGNLPVGPCSPPSPRTPCSVPKPRLLTLSLSDPVGGTPVRSGELVHVTAEGDALPCTVLLFSAGFYAVSRTSSHTTSVAWSPFTVIREASVLASTGSERELPGFTLCIPAHSLRFAFAAPAAVGMSQKAECLHWLRDMAGSLRDFTRSLFPPSLIAVEPLAHVPHTLRRIMAGYLLRAEQDGAASLVYCELQAYCRGSSQLVMYDNECCRHRDSSISLTGLTKVVDRMGVDSSLFSVGGLSFCARTVEEKRVWLRAITNVKVKILNGAPIPSEEDLAMFRSAVLERVVSLEVSTPIDEDAEIERPMENILMCDVLSRPTTMWPRAHCGSPVFSAATLHTSRPPPVGPAGDDPATPPFPDDMCIPASPSSEGRLGAVVPFGGFEAAVEGEAGADADEDGRRPECPSSSSPGPGQVHVDRPPRSGPPGPRPTAAWPPRLGPIMKPLGGQTPNLLPPPLSPLVPSHLGGRRFSV